MAHGQLTTDKSISLHYRSCSLNDYIIFIVLSAEKRIQYYVKTELEILLAISYFFLLSSLLPGSIMEGVPFFNAILQSTLFCFTEMYRRQFSEMVEAFSQVSTVVCGS